MPLQKNETSRSGGSATATACLRLVLARSAIIVGTRAMFLLLLTNTATGAGIAARLAMLHVAAAWIAAKRLISGNTVTRSELDFQLDDFVPLLVGSITLGDRKEVTQAATRIRRRGYRNGSFGGIFWIRIVHCNLKKAEPVEDDLRIP
ncbi:MAG: hypothetical protein FD131_4747 [Rhodocyclaceae bacterium]|nr:MAG: hypothetical protein FD131_4747 [Rhodocyclaceae bacterium]